MIYLVSCQELFSNVAKKQLLLFDYVSRTMFI